MIFRKLEELFVSGSVAARLYIDNRAVPLTVDDMLSVPFGIHFDVDGITPGIEVEMRPDRLSRMIINEGDLSQVLDPVPDQRLWDQFGLRRGGFLAHRSP